MNLPQFSAFLWLVLFLAALVFLQRSLHNELIRIFFLIFRKLNTALYVFSILFFPGVVIHEVSHWLMAKLLRVRTGKMSLLPELLPDGKLRMGYVETVQAGVIRDSLVGAAPILFGSLIVGYAGLEKLNVGVFWGAETIVSANPFWDKLDTVFMQPDFWLWFYLIFIVSSTMMPSESDRRAWRPVILFAVFILGVSLLSGAGPWIVNNLSPSIDPFLRSLNAILGTSAVVHLVLLAPIYLFRRFLNQVTGLRIVQQ